jgi:mycothiol synthase
MEAPHDRGPHGGGIRTATDADVPALRLVAARSFDRERLHRAGVVDLLFTRPGVHPSLRLVATRGEEVVGLAFASTGRAGGDGHGDGSEDATGFVDALAVAPHARRQGVGTALLAEAEVRLAAAGCRQVQLGGTTWFYAWPGIDLAYTAALAMAERAGFVQQEVVHNMDVDLRDWVPGLGAASLAPPSVGAPGVGQPGGGRPGEAPVQVRRAAAEDGPALHDLAGAHFDAVWDHELALALGRERPTVFVAERAGRLIGFGAHGVYRADLFGPLATVPGERSGGVGRALLHACLDDMAAAGLATAQIGWIGPAGFYARTVGARIGRSFAILRRSGAAGPRGAAAGGAGA